jgi:hypothetical protein
MLNPELAIVLLGWDLQASEPSTVVRQGMELRVAEGQGLDWQILAPEDTLIRASG